MSTFAELGQAFKNIDPYALLREVMSEGEIQSWIKNTVTNRLFDDGVTGSLKRLRTDRSFEQGTDAYSFYTQGSKEKKGLPTDHVTLFDEGTLHKSFKVVLKEWGWSQNMDFLNSKYTTDIYQNFTRQYTSPEEFENDVESLTEDEIDELIETQIYPNLMKKIDALL